jgi:lysophospholipase L1-like esterase
MKRVKTAFLTLVGCMCFVSASWSQEAKWDSTHRPGIFKLKTDQFRSFPNSHKDIIFLGNSITAGVDWVELVGNRHARNRGISGDITFGVLERLDEVIEGRPAKVFLLIGINDISRNIPDEVILQNYQRMVTRIKRGSPKTRIYLQTLLPVNSSFGKFPNHYHKDQHILAVNQGLRELAAREKITLVDLYPAFLDNQNRLVAAYTHDGLHLTALGYQKWAEVLKNGKYLK